jgi:hypothetical protein
MKKSIALVVIVFFIAGSASAQQAPKPQQKVATQQKISKDSAGKKAAEVNTIAVKKAPVGFRVPDVQRNGTSKSPAAKQNSFLPLPGQEKNTATDTKWANKKAKKEK